MWDGRRDPARQPSLIAIRNLDEHARVRKRWNRAFSTASVKEYEPIIVRRTLQLAEELGKRTESVVDLAEWLSFFTYVTIDTFGGCMIEMGD